MKFWEALGFLFLVPGVVLALYFVGVSGSMSSRHAGEAGPVNLFRLYALLVLAVLLISAGYFLINFGGQFFV